MATTPADPPAEGETTADQPADTSAMDPKERYRQALEAKKNKSGYGAEAHLAGGSASHGSSAKSGGKREFRRKSG